MLNIRLKIFFALLLSCKLCIAQNLVPNGSFEMYTACPTGNNQINSAAFWFNPTTSFYGTPDYFNQCATNMGVSVPDNSFGYQVAHTGGAYAGLGLFYVGFVPLNNWREYIETSLTSPLIAGSTYCFEMYISAAEFGRYSTDAVGVYFSDTALIGLTYYNINVTPDIANPIGNFADTSNWMLVSGNYVASGGESYLIIGRFGLSSGSNWIETNPSRPDAAYIFIDDVSLIECQPTGIAYQEQNNFLTIYPNPFTEKLNFSIPENEPAEIILYDSFSRELFKKKFIHSITIDTKHFAYGMYFYEVKNNGVIRKGKIVKH